MLIAGNFEGDVSHSSPGELPNIVQEFVMPSEQYMGGSVALGHSQSLFREIDRDERKSSTLTRELGGKLTKNACTDDHHRFAERNTRQAYAVHHRPGNVQEHRLIVRHSVRYELHVRDTLHVVGAVSSVAEHTLPYLDPGDSGTQSRHLAYV